MPLLVGLGVEPGPGAVSGVAAGGGEGPGPLPGRPAARSSIPGRGLGTLLPRRHRHLPAYLPGTLLNPSSEIAFALSRIEMLVQQGIAPDAKTQKRLEAEYMFLESASIIWQRLVIL